MYPLQLGQDAGTCSWPSSGSPSPGWARRSTWRRSSAAASRSGQGLLVNLLFGGDPAGRRGQPVGRGAGHQGHARRRLVLARPPGLGVPGTGPALADPALRRADLLAGDRLPGDGPSPARRRTATRLRVADRSSTSQRDPGGGLLRLRPVLRPRHAPDHRRLLALVRGAHLGGEHLRVLRRGGDLAVPGDAGPGVGQVGAAGGLLDGRSWSSSAASSARPTTTSGTAARASGWPSAACSARWSRSR